MSKVMFVTVGTSLFHSATWEWSESMRQDVHLYEKWTEDHGEATDLLRSPEGRKASKNADRIIADLKFRLTEDNAASWAHRLPADLRNGNPDRGTVMRYSAELATILKLSEQDEEGDGSLGAFLRSYQTIELACDPSRYAGRSLSFVAASHLREYLNLVAGEPRARVCKISGLSSPHIEDLWADDGGLAKLGEKVGDILDRASFLDVIVSGGFRIYGLYLAPLMTQKWARLAYIHEEGADLITIPRIAPKVPPEARRIREMLRANRTATGRFS
jgi:hypothetical protein